MAHSDKNIVITPNTGSSTLDPQIVFSGADGSVSAQNITCKVYPNANGTISFEGSAGQLFSISNNLSSGSIFNVSDISGASLFDVNADGTLQIGVYNTNTTFGGPIVFGTNSASVAAWIPSGTAIRNFALSATATHYFDLGNIQFRAGDATLNHASCQIYITHATQSTSAITGAFVVTGGVGIGKNLCVGNMLTTLGSHAWKTNVVTTGLTLDSTHHVVIGNHASTPFTITLPAASTTTGHTYVIKNKGAAAVTVAGNGANFFTNSSQASLTLNVGDSVIIVYDGAIWVVVD
jgi:hypothetical protein